MIILYAIAALAAIGLVAAGGYVVWCAATILSKGIDFNESYASCPVANAVKNLTSTGADADEPVSGPETAVPEQHVRPPVTGSTGVVPVPVRETLPAARA